MSLSKSVMDRVNKAAKINKFEDTAAEIAIEKNTIMLFVVTSTNRRCVK